LSVLVVEDDLMVLEVLAAVLGKAGVDLKEATSGARAMTMLRRDRSGIDALVTDIRLGDLLNGWSVADEYRRLHPHAPIVYISAYAMDHRRIVPLSCAFRKPLGRKDMSAMVEFIKGVRGTAEGSQADVRGQSSMMAHR
jgi:two-component system, OmpR family, response regulator